MLGCGCERWRDECAQRAERPAAAARRGTRLTAGENAASPQAGTEPRGKRERSLVASGNAASPQAATQPRRDVRLLDPEGAAGVGAGDLVGVARDGDPGDGEGEERGAAEDADEEARVSEGDGVAEA